MKKVSLLILVSMILLLAFASCDMLPPLFGEEPEPEHVHDWMEATCEAPKTCACGATEGEALPHTWAEATCSSPKVCTFCNKTEGSALNHKWVEADCDTPATCSLCGITSGEAQGHLWISASCDSAKHCANCDIVEGEPLEHVWEAATCLTPKTCTLCKATDGPALGHTEETVPGFAATCTENGLSDGSVCTVCGTTTLAQQVIPAFGHTASDWVVTSLPTCTEPGSQYQYCTVCSTEDNVVVLNTKSDSALGHTEGEWIVDLAPTCDTKGKQHKECTVCGATVKTALIPVEGHEAGEAVVENNKAPDCENAGSYDLVVYCKTCGDELSRETKSVDPLGHKMTNATCQAPSTCTVCGHTEGTVVPCKAGETKKENEVAPTCEADGSYDLATYCVWCNTELSRKTETVDALGHDMAPATCDAPSTCKNGCGKTEGEPLKNHTVQVSYSDGVLLYTCATCYEVYCADKALAYDGEKLPQLAKNGDPTITVNANGQYEVKAGSQKSQYMLYFPSNSKGHADMFTDFTGAKNSVGVLSFRFKAGNVTENIRFIVMTARDNPNWDASGGWNGCSMDLLTVKPNGDGTYTVNGNNITGNTFATVSGDEWVDVKMFMQLTPDGMFRISYYVNGAFCNVYERDLLNAGSAQTIKDLMIQSVYVCGWTEAGTGWAFDDLYFGYANDCEWVFDEHEHVWADANCTAPKTCTACGATEGEALGHAPVSHDAKAPTCTEIGWDAYETCSRCDHTTYVELPATGHNYGSATCDQAATCSVCGFSTGEALGHEFKAEAYVYNNDAKCGVDGTKTAKCSRCDATDTLPAEGTALEHNWADANCATASKCTLCGITQGEPDKAMHDKLTCTNANGVTTYACATCGYSFKVDIGDFMDGTHYNGMAANAPNNTTYYTTNPDNNKLPVLTNGYYEYVRNDVEAGAQKQLQLWLPSPNGGTNKFSGFSAANNSIGYLSFSINAYTDHNLEMKLVDNRVDNLDLNGDGEAESIRWGDAWAINDPVFRVLPPSGGKAQLVGFNSTLLATVDVDENNYTGWIDVAIQIVLDPVTDQVIATYYINGAYVATSARPLSTHTDAIQSVYINSNNKAPGTGYKIDNLAFGYTAHKHDFAATVANGVLTYTCECGGEYRVEEFHKWNGSEGDSALKNLPNGNVTLNVNDKGQYEYIFAPSDPTVPNFTAGTTKNEKLNGWFEYEDTGAAGGQLQMWMPSNNRGEGTFEDFSCENNAVGVISFKVKSNLTRCDARDTSLTFSVGKPRNAADWNDGGSWNDDSINIFTIEDTLANGATIKGGLNGTNLNFGVIPAGEDGWTEWFDVMMAIEMTDNGYLTIYYYINGEYVGSDSRDLNNPGGYRTLNPKKIEALQISGWTYAANTGIVFDDFYFGYTVEGHNTLDGHVHNVTKAANCGGKDVCSCGWEGASSVAHDFTEATCGAPATCKNCGMTKGESLTHNSLVAVPVDGNVQYTCKDCNKYYTLDGGMHDMGDVSDATTAGLYNKTYDGKTLTMLNNGSDANAQHQFWIPGQTVSPDLAGFTCANNATGFLSFTINSKDDHNTGIEFKVNANRGTGNWGGPTNNGWSESSVGVFKIFPHKDTDTTVKISGYNGATLGDWTMTGTDGWTGEMNVVIKIQLYANNTVSLDYYINGEFFANVKADMVIWTYDISSLYVNGRTNSEGDGYILSDLYFGYTLNGLHDAPVVEEPFYNEVIDEANVKSETLKTIVASKIKQCDQAKPSGNADDLFAEGGTPVYVLADKNGETVEALYFSRTVAWTGKETKQLFTEFRFDVDGTKKATAISFDYKIKGTVEKNDRFTFTDLEGNKFSADAYVQIKTPAKHELATDNYPELSGTDLILDGEWHTMSYTFAEPLEIINVLVNLYKFQGQLLISNFNVEFEEPVVEEPFYNEVIDVANVQSETLKTIVASKIKQCDQSNPGSDPSKDLFAEGGTPVYVLADKNGETVEALYISRSVAWLGTEAAHFTEFRFAINGEKEGPAVTSISFDYKIEGTVAKNERYQFTDFDGTKFYSDAYVQVKTISKDAAVIEQAGDNYPELAGTDLVLDGEWHTFTYNFATPRYLIDFLLNLYQFQGELLIANIEIEYYEEPFYTEEIAKEDVSSAILQTVVTNKIKQWDQSDDHNVHTGTPVFVKADMNGETVTGLYFSRTTPWVGDEKEQFSEFRVNVDGSKKATGFSFVYKVEGTVDENKGSGNGGYTFKDLEGNAFTADAYVQIKTPVKHELAGDDYPELSGTDLILDGEWHTMTYTFAQPLEIINILFNLYHFQGQLIVAELEVEFVKECQHTNTTTNKADATCTVAGYEKVTCDDCGATLSEKTFPATNHANKTTTSVDATCTTAGSNKVVCDDCGATLVDETIAALGHKLAVTTVSNNVTCTCTTCGASYVADTSYSYTGNNTTWNWSQGATSDISLNVVDGEYVISANSEVGSQYMLYVPSSSRNSAMQGFTGEANAFGVISFRVKTNAQNYVDAETGKLVQPGTVRFILMEARNANDNWKGWSDNSVDVLAIQPNNDGTYKVHGNSMTSTTLTTVAANEWLDVKMLVRITPEQTMTIDYYLNDSYCGSYTKDFNAENYGMRLLNNLIESLYLCGWTQGQGTGVTLDDLYIGYSAEGHNVFEGEHNTVSEATCQAGAVCSCGWTGAPVAHKLGYNMDGEAVVCSCAFEGCEEGYRLEKGWYFDGTNTEILPAIKQNYDNGAYVTDTNGKFNTENGYLVFNKAETTTGTKGQFQIHFRSADPTTANKYFPNFKAESNAKGVLEFKINPNLDNTGNLRFIICERVSSGFAWGTHSIDLLTFSPANANGEITLSGWGTSAFATFKKGADGYTGWISVKVTIELSLNAEGAPIALVNYYVNGELKATTHSASKIVSGNINELYITGNSTNKGTGYMLDDLVFGYTAHEHVYAEKDTKPTCTDKGFTTFTCDCGDTYTGNEVAALGHDYDDANCTSPRTCAICDATEGEALGHADENGDFKCDRCSTKMLPAAGEALTVAQAIAIGKLYTKDTYTTDKYYLTGIITEVQNTTYGNIVISDGTNSILVYGLYSYDGKTRYDAMSYKPVVGDEITVFGVIGYYTASQMKNGWLDEVVAHDHEYSEATCEAPATCKLCGLTQGEKAEHNFVDGTCSVCGSVEGGVTIVEKKLSFSSKNNRTEFNTSKQVWAQNEVTLTNDKSSSTSNVADYASPARFYAGSKITVDCAGMTKIVFDCNSGSYATALKNSLGTISGATVTVSSDKVTVEFTSAVDTLVIAKLTAQVRMDAITVYAAE